MAGSNERLLKALRLIQQAPRTRPELALELSTRSDVSGQWVRLLEKHGFIRVRGRRRKEGSGKAAIEWEIIKEA